MDEIRVELGDGPPGSKRFGTLRQESPSAAARNLKD
jgi:hypothetical protein